jgi:hypothetical protein
MVSMAVPMENVFHALVGSITNNHRRFIEVNAMIE